jgi:hypothetical protein
VELLIVSAKGEILVALDTGNGAVGIVQVFQLSSVGLVHVRPELEDYPKQSNVQSVPFRY